MKAVIKGVGHYVPENIITNNDLAAIINTSDEWITERTGIKQRRYFSEGFDTTSNMAYKATLKALKNANINKTEIDCIIFSTLSPDYNFPGSGVLLQHLLGINTIPAFDIRQQCSGFIYGLQMADAFIKSKQNKTILLVCSEIQSNILELSNRGRNVAVIFGDGAAAVIIQATNDNLSNGIISTHIHSEGKYAEELILKHPGSRLKNRLTKQMIENGEHLPYMNGPAVFKHAVTRFEEVILEALNANALNSTDIDLLIPHQANLRISEFIQRKLNLPNEKVFNNIQFYGNTTSASIPIALSEAIEKGLVKQGNILCFAAFGSGFTWGSALVKW